MPSRVKHGLLLPSQLRSHSRVDSFVWSLIIACTQNYKPFICCTATLNRLWRKFPISCHTIDYIQSHLCSLKLCLLLSHITCPIDCFYTFPYTAMPWPTLYSVCLYTLVQTFFSLSYDLEQYLSFEGPLV